MNLWSKSTSFIAALFVLNTLSLTAEGIAPAVEEEQLFSNHIAYARLLHQLRMAESPLIHVPQHAKRSPSAVTQLSEGGALLGHLAPETQNIFADALKLENTVPANKKDLTHHQGLRLTHAKELLGRFYKRSVVRASENVRNLEIQVTEWTKRALPREFKKHSKKIAKAILSESKTHGFDPIFLMALIENESSFNPMIRGTSGEIGLMQILPGTAKWIAKKNNLPWKGEKTLRDPVANIKIGSAYIAQLREQFDSHSQLYVSAYNMGPGNVNKALGRSIWPKEYVGRVMQRYIRFYTELRENIKKHG